MTPFSSDFLNWNAVGQLVLQGRPVSSFGVYAGPAYISGAALWFWISLTHNATVQSQIQWLYLHGPADAGSSTTPEMYAFTLVMKLPLLITDLITTMAIVSIVRSTTSSTSRGLLAGLLWSSSPLIFLLEETTPVEIYPALLILIGAFAFHRMRALFGLITGSAFLALATIIRFSPLLVIWIYVIAFARSRQIKNLIAFLGIQVAAILLAVYYFVHTSGWGSIVAMVSSRPGVVIPEVLTTIGPFLTATIVYTPYRIGLSFPIYILLAYFITKPGTWQNRPIGAEVLAFFAPYYALTSFHAPFLLWVLPTLLVYAFTSRFGPLRLLVCMTLGFLFYLFEASKHLMGEFRPSAVFYFPNVNATMVSLSANLYQLYLTQPLPQVFRSLFSASLLWVVFWLLRKEAEPIFALRSQGAASSVSATESPELRQLHVQRPSACRMGIFLAKASSALASMTPNQPQVHSLKPGKVGNLSKGGPLRRHACRSAGCSGFRTSLQ